MKGIYDRKRITSPQAIESGDEASTKSEKHVGKQKKKIVKSVSANVKVIHFFTFIVLFDICFVSICVHVIFSTVFFVVLFCFMFCV